MAAIYSPAAVQKGLRINFMRGMAQAPAPKLLQLCEITQSDTDSETYEWLGQAPQMAEFKGSRNFSGMTNTTYSLANVTYDAGITIGRDHFADNKSGSLAIRAGQLVSVAAANPDKVISAAIEANGNCYDGTAHYGNSHTARADEGSAQDNLLAGTGTGESALLTDFAAAKAAMLGFNAENGEPFHAAGLGQLVVHCAPGLEVAFRRVLGSGVISNTSNVLVGEAQLIVDPRLTDADDWYLHCVDPGKKPFIFQMREELRPDEIGMDTEKYNNLRQIQYGVSARYAAGLGFWQSTVKTTN